ncbi:MAG: HIRAN domain-containing protein [Lachnospiraceae bacterium]|nr:HIRAN domain-containing protein [Lachnospiraceae bacterium]
MADELIIKKKDELATANGATLDKMIKPLTHEILLFDSYVAGTGYIKDQSILDGITVGTKLALRREPENKFDDKAILVLDEQKRKVGYIPEKDNIVFARLMDAGKYLTAKVVRTEEKGSFRQINISIYLVDF